jgi:splicing factor 3B subunit 3
MLALDYNTVVGADKFDNLFANRVPIEVREDSAGTGEATLGSGGLRLGPDTAYILGKNHKLDPLNQFHLGETVTALQKTSLSPGSSQVVLYSTLSGALGVLYPFLTKKEYELFLGLESHMRSALGSSLVGRDHCAFRSYYLPAKGVVDGDLVSSFAKLPNKAQIAQLVGKSVNEIEKMIEEIHNRIT